MTLNRKKKLLIIEKLRESREQERVLRVKWREIGTERKVLLIAEQFQ